jgi:hypothetical protein
MFLIIRDLRTLFGMFFLREMSSLTEAPPRGEE